MSDATRPDANGQAKRILAAVLDSSDDAIIGWDLSGRVLTWSRGAERLYGYTDAEIVGQSISLLIPDDHAGEFTSKLKRVTAGERLDHHATVRRARDGRLVHVVMSVRPIFGDDGRVIGALTLATDQTARLRTEAALDTSEARWRAVVKSAVDGIIVIDAQGRIESFNPAAERLFGYSEQDVIGRNVKLLMPSPYHEEHDGYLERYQTTGEPRIIGIGREVTGRRKDGTTFPLHLAVGELNHGGDRKFTGILHDLSDRVRMEERLRERTALARLGEMAAVIAHEVKNPLAGIRGAVQVIGSRLPQDSRDAMVMKEIVNRVDGLNNLMKDLLLFARPPQPNPAPVDLRSLLATTADLLSADPSVAGVHVTVEGSVPPICADAELLKIVFVNLFVNGAHAMQGKGEIRVLLRPADGGCSVAVQDRGPGIPPDVRQQIFTPFFTTKARGSGLGLPTAKRLIEAHSGTINVECPPDGGTTVTIELPS